MFKKQARAWSAILVVCMLLSLLTTFALPVSAEGESGTTTTYYDEVVPAKGLVDTTDMKDISAYATDTKVYKVSDRAGLEKLNSLVLSGDTLAGVTIYQAADIDLKWENFPGIGATGKLFSGTYNGNGYVIEGLYVQNASAEGAGLFNDAKEATFWNVGIASGLIIGGMRAGSITGGYETHANLKFYNCWSAATVVGGGNNGTGGLAATSTGASAFYNCYFLGMVYSREAYPGGLTGYMDADLHMENSFNYGTVVAGLANRYSAYYTDGVHNALIRPSGKTLGTVGKNNAYRKQERIRSTYDSFVANSADTTNDNGVGYSAEAFANGEVAAKMNGHFGHPEVGQVDDYIMLFTQSEAGYPVATYLDNDTLEPIAKRTAHHTTNVGENTLAEKSELFKYFSDNLGNFPSKAKLGNYEIDNAYDLFAMSLLTSFRGLNNASTSFARLGLTGITITEDIDMADMKDLFPIDNFVPMGSLNPFTIPVDGQGHVIKNWKTVTYVMPQIVNGDPNPYANTFAQSGFIAMGAGKISNLGLENAVTVLDFHLANPAEEKPAGGLLVGYQSGSLQISNCYVTGEVIVRNENAYNDNGIGALVGFDSTATTVFNGGWVDAKIKLEYAGTEDKLTAYGGTNSAIVEENVKSVYYFAENGQGNTGSPVTAGYQTRLNAASDLNLVAIDLNQVAGKAMWGVEENKLAFATEENAVVGVYYQKVGASGYVAGDPVVVPAKPGDVITLPTGDALDGAFKNYEPDASSYPDSPNEVENGQFKMPARNVEIRYIANTFDKDLVQSIYDYYNGMNEEFFTQETVGTLRNIKRMASYLLANAEGDAGDLFAVQTELEELIMNSKLELVGVYPNIPNYSDYELLKDYNTSGVWGIDSKEDWIALTNVPVAAFDAKIELHLKQDIDLENLPTMPMYYGGTFKGTIDGHGYAFKNLNVTMEDPNTGIAIGGLVAEMSGATIRNLGIESGIVKVTNHQPLSDNHGAGVITGFSTGSTFTKVWVDSGVTFELNNCKQNSSYAVIAGRGANVFESCYSYCKMRGDGDPNHISHMGDWINSTAGQLNNCFAVTDVNSGNSVYMYRANGSLNDKQSGNNLWIVGGTDVHHSSTIATNSGKLSAGAEKNGELAYKLWANYTEGRGTKYYYTVKDDKTVVGEKADQYYRVRVSIGYENHDFYGKKGATVDISGCGLTAEELVVVEGSVGERNGLKVTMGEGDMNLKAINPNGPTLYSLDQVLAKYKVYNKEEYITDFSYFKDGDALKKKLDEVITKYPTYTKENQAEIDEAAEFLKNGYILDETKKVPASYSNSFCEIEGNGTYPEVGIYNLADLAFAESKSTSYGSGQTLYLCADLDLTNSNFQYFNTLKAKFDGQGYTISNFDGNTSFFHYVRSTSIKNMVFKNCNPCFDRDSSGIVGNYQYDNITTTLENITIEDCVITRPGGKAVHGAAAVFGENIKKSKLVFNNITVRGTTIDTAEDGKEYDSSAMIISRVRAAGSVTMNNILVENCVNRNGAKGKDGNAALVFGTMSLQNEPVLTMNNVIVRDNTISAGYIGTDGILGNVWGFAYNKVIMNNVVAYNNNVGKAGLIGNYEDSYGTVIANDVYTDATVHYKNERMDGVNVYDTEAFTTGAFAYMLNEKNDEDIFALDANGGMIFASETVKAPTKQNITVNGGTHFAAYTDGTGKLTVWDGILSKIAAKWPGMPCVWETGDPTAYTYVADGIINATVEGAAKEYACNHNWQYHYTEDGKHTGECEFCGIENIEPCTVEWNHGARSHNGICTGCKHYFADEDCDLVSIEVIADGCEHPRSEVFECTVCGDVKYLTSRLAKPIGHSLKYQHNEEKPGTHYVVCERGCGLSQLDNCIEGSYNVVEPTTGSVGYTEWTCSACGGKWQQNHVNAVATLSIGGVALLDGGRESAGAVDVTVIGDPGLGELNFTVNYVATELTFVAAALKNTEIADLYYDDSVPGVVSVTVIAKEGKTTKVDGALLDMTFEPQNTVDHKQYDLTLANVSGISAGKSTSVEAAEAVGYVRVISHKDLNTDTVVDTMDLRDLICYILEKEPSSPVRADLANINNDPNGDVDLLDAVDLARALSKGVY